jgi:hypothetical protein
MSRDIAHRGYLIRVNFLGVHWIEKDGHVIVHYCRDVDDGRRIIDELLGGAHGTAS